MFENRKLKDFNPDIIYIHTSNANVLNYPVFTDTYEEVQHKMELEISRFKSLWNKIRVSYDCCIIQNNFELPSYRVLGNLDSSDIHGRTNFLMQLNLEFAKWAQTNNNFFINDINYLSATVGLEKWADKNLWYLYKYALSYDAIPVLSQNIAKIVKSIYGKSKKCLILDMDNTLWGGIVGEDGDKIKIGKETATGEAYREFQEYVKKLKDMGVILAVCSKNSIDTAKEGISHPDNILSENDFSVFIANWEPKHENILSIAQKLNISLDSMVFIDDSSVEREIVKSQLPPVAVPDVGSDIVKFIDHIDKAGYFEPVRILDEDINRNKYYELNRKVEDIKSEFANYDDFLMSLDMRAEIGFFKPGFLDRITQLTNKTNQFNLTSRRYNLPEIESIMGNDSYISLYGKLADKFGDYGIVSVLIGHIRKSVLEIDLWLMSCRVLKRNMELAMFDELVLKSKDRGVREIVGYYYRTPKNDMVSGQYESLGFALVSKTPQVDSIWKFAVPEHYEPRNVIIKVSP
jgi:FkbH-like protein